MVRIFAESQIVRRAQIGELEIDAMRKAKRTPATDYSGLLLTQNENAQFLDKHYDPSDCRYIAAKTHRHLDANGVAGWSGKYDPKSVTIADGTKYQLMAPDGHCERCEGGEMIPRSRRFRHSTYKP